MTAKHMKFTTKAIVIKFIVSQAIPHEILAPHAFFFINYCHHVIAIETTCASQTSLIATLSFEAASKIKQNGQQYH